jgi:hypothetical protein
MGYFVNETWRFYQQVDARRDTELPLLLQDGSRGLGVGSRADIPRFQEAARASSARIDALATSVLQVRERGDGPPRGGAIANSFYAFLGVVLADEAAPDPDARVLGAVRATIASLQWGGEGAATGSEDPAAAAAAVAAETPSVMLPWVREPVALGRLDGTALDHVWCWVTMLEAWAAAVLAKPEVALGRLAVAWFELEREEWSEVERFQRQVLADDELGTLSARALNSPTSPPPTFELGSGRSSGQGDDETYVAALEALSAQFATETAAAFTAGALSLAVQAALLLALANFLGGLLAPPPPGSTVVGTQLADLAAAATSSQSPALFTGGLETIVEFIRRLAGF